MASPEQRRVDTNPVRRNSNRANGVVDGSGRQPSNSPVRIRERKNSFARQVSLESGIGILEIESAGNNGVGSSSSPLHNKISKNERLLSRNGRSLGVGVGTGVGAKRGDFNMFRTKSTLSKQPSLLPVRKENSDFELVRDCVNGGGPPENLANETVPAGRYFAALRGPELDQVRDYEDILLPKDELWPFLLRFPIGCFGITLGLSSQAILWRAIATSPATAYLHVSPIVNVVLWILALVVLTSISITYGLKCAFYFEAVRREYFHPIRVNFFFAPWIVCMFLAIGVPPIITPKNVHPAVWCVFMFPVVILELKIYGQWLSGGKRRLCKVANPSSHLSVVGNFVGAILAAKVGWKEPAKFFWAIGFAHYIVLFVTLYQRLPTNEALPKELHPVYSMFIAAPSAASIAWQMIYGEFDEVSRTCYFIALFLYCSLVVRINFFTGFRFSVAWWSYTFPMTTASLATIKYSEAVPCVISRGLVLILSGFSSSMVFLLFVCTLMHALYYHTLFPNDLAIAITKNKISGGGGKQKDKKGGKKKSYDIRRWAKNAPLSLVSAITKNGNGSHKSRDKD